jgi:hypothetical protein
MNTVATFEGPQIISPDHQVETTPVKTSAVQTSPPESTPAETLLGQTGRSLREVRKRLFKLNRASDAHTDGEERLYRFMWSQAKEISEGTRALPASVSVLARAVGRDDRNTRPLIESLIRKLSIEIAKSQDFRTGSPRVYYVYDYPEIQRRRVERGLEWALKNKGIQLLTGEEASQLQSV